jgi:hypothetical protein
VPTAAQLSTAHPFSEKSPSGLRRICEKAALLRAEARLARRVPYDLDSNEKLDPMQVLEEAMRHFYRKAKIEESLGRFCDFRIVDKAIETAARIGREIVSFRHPRISAIKLAVADPNADLLRGDMTADEMREIIRGKLIEEGLLPALVEHQGLVREEFRQDSSIGLPAISARRAASLGCSSVFTAIRNA